MLLRKDGNLWVLATKTKCEFLKPAAENVPTKSPIRKIHFLLRNKQDANAANYQELITQLENARINDEKRRVGMLLKERADNAKAAGILGPWEAKLSAWADNDTTELVDVSPGIAFSMSVKDDTELDLMKKSSVLSNKVMKHGLVKKMEQVIDSEEAITNEALATYVEQILADPSKIDLKVPNDDVQSCYFPIVQSGGTYDLKVSAQPNDNRLTYDVITVSLGARYKFYCSNIARTFLVDPPKKVSETYEVLLELQESCLSAMKPGNPLKAVYKAAVRFLQDRNGYEYLVDHLPRNLGFAMGLDFREGSLLLSPKNSAVFKPGMVFCLSVGFQNLDLSESDRSSTPDKSPVSYLKIFVGLFAHVVTS